MKNQSRSTSYLRQVAFVLALSAVSVAAGAQTCFDVFSHKPKSVAQKYFDSYEALKANEIEETAGIEIEAAAPFSVGARGVAETIASELEKSGISVERSFRYETLTYKNKTEVYKIKYVINGSTYTYAVKQDYSVLAGAGHVPLEFVSPILRNEADYERHIKLVDAISALGVKAEPNTAGVHVHVGMKNVTVGELGLLGYVFQSIEKDLTRKFRVAQTRLPFIRPTDPVLQEIFATNGTLGTDVQTFLHANFQGPLARRHALNMLSLLKFTTVEFRLFNSTLDPVVLDFERRFALGLIKAIRMKNPAFIEWVLKLEKGEGTFEELIDGIGLSRAEWTDVQRRINSESDALVRGKGSLLLRNVISGPISLYKGYVEPLFHRRPPAGWAPHN